MVLKLLVQLQDVSLSYGEKKIFSQVHFNIHTQEKLCVLGRNGAGKSSLFKLITRELEPDSGEVHLRNNIVVSQLDQDLPTDLTISVFDYVRSGLHHLQTMLEDFHRLRTIEAPSNQLKKTTPSNTATHRCQQCLGYRCSGQRNL